jgi:hypothetical protein
MRRLGLIAGAALVLAACGGGQQEQLRIADVAVEADLSAVGSREAVGYWGNLAPDLEAAIASQFLGRIDPEGYDILVNIDELSLASPFAPAATAETARLSGQVELISPAGTREAVYNVTATATDVVDFLPAGTDIVTVRPTSAEYYQAIVQAFARGTMLTLDGTEL